MKMVFLFVHIVIQGMVDIDFDGTNDIWKSIQIWHFNDIFELYDSYLVRLCWVMIDRRWFINNDSWFTGHRNRQP